MSTLRLDLHVHSDASYDGREPVELLLEHAADIGLDGIVVTDHDEIDASLRAARLAPDYGLVGVPGVEVSTEHGHLLAVGVEECPDPGMGYRETAAAVRDAGGVAIAPHPFQRSRHGVRRRHLTPRGGEHPVDAIEVYNSMLFTGYRNRRARRFARSQGLPGVGASDAHYLMNLGRAYTTVEVPGPDAPANVDYRDVVAAIRDGATGVAGGRTPVRRSASQYAKGAVRKSVFVATSRAPFVSAYPVSMRE
ncbi:putative metal-dependent phosphoesterase TrpH [Halarchaeum rubridurum]|uniref:Phosphoesterase n=1 Tax=Halarchaeum rubridurum TaxID=489911 RepID=A0A830FYY2_9EURY|nr:PHP domain-containing protein [Halarchaeum rubridurum]MBP1953430.1 putative metal-dependent phosphoesterase TrpH [Halarchaeum rubridurum]GGM65327.1 phosphoesterase [Halarchaeum rubridurum]